MPFEPKNRWAYVRLICEHLTTPEIQEFYSFWKPKRGLNYCEYCAEWVKRKPRNKRAKLPDDPPY